MSKITKVKHVSTQFSDVKHWFDNHMSPDVIDFDDPRPYEVYSDGRYAGIFQCTGKGAQQLFIKAKPKSIIDIAALTSIYRPGPLASHVDKLWLKHENEPYDWGHPLINETLKETRGCLAEGTLVLTEDGVVPIEQIVDSNSIGTTIVSLNESTLELERDEIIAVADNGMASTLLVETELGLLELTPDHLVLTDTRGWQRADQLVLTDEILSIEEYLSFK